MARIVKLNKGFTLVELLVSMVIIAICVIGLMNLSIVITRNNVKNEIRNKAVEIITNTVDNITSSGILDFNNTTTIDIATLVGNGGNVTGQVRGKLNQKYYISGNVTSPSTDEKDINATISWTYREKNYNYNIETVVTK